MIEQTLPSSVNSSAPARNNRGHREGQPAGIDQRRPSLREQAGQAFQPLASSTRSATAICSVRLAWCGIPEPPKERQVDAVNCSPPWKPLPVLVAQSPPLSHCATLSQVLTGVPLSAVLVVSAGATGAPACALLGAVVAGACAGGGAAAAGADGADVTPPGVPVRSMVPMVTAAVRATTTPRPTQIGVRLRRPGARMDARTRCAGPDATASAMAERNRRRPFDA